VHAITIETPGGPETLRWTEVPDLAAPGPGEVTIDVVAAGVNNADRLQRQGGYPVPKGASPVLGLECSGRIAAIGEGVEGFALGDAVCALLSGGGYAQQVVVPAVQVLPVPAGVDIVEAAGIPEVAATVYSNLRMLAGLEAGRSVLIHGAGSGIGTFAVQWAAAIGARVLATAGSRRKLDVAATLGAAVLIDYREQDFVAEVLAATDGAGVDAVLDLVGAPYLERNLACLGFDGHLLLLGGDLAPTAVPLGRLMQRRASLSVTSLRSRPVVQKGAIVAGLAAEVWPLCASGRIRPVIDSVVPVAQAAAAHRLLEGGGTIGKVLLDVAGAR
jgi:NADPH2:quinone reductase